MREREGQIKNSNRVLIVHSVCCGYYQGHHPHLFFCSIGTWMPTSVRLVALVREYVMGALFIHPRNGPEAEKEGEDWPALS